MTTISEGFTTCVADGDCLSVLASPTPTAALYAELEIDPVGGIRCTVNGLAAQGGAVLASPASPPCGTATPGAPFNNAIGQLPDGSPFLPDHFVGDRQEFFSFGLPNQPPIPLNTYAALNPTVVVNNNWCRDALLLAYVFNNANIGTQAGSRYELRSEVGLDGAPFVPLQHTPLILGNSPTAFIHQDKATSASVFVDPYGFNPIVVPAGGSRTIRFRTGVFLSGGIAQPGDFWANVGTFIYNFLATTE